MSKLSDILMQGGDTRKRVSSNSNASSSKVVSGNSGSIMSLRMRSKPPSSGMPKPTRSRLSAMSESMEYSKKHRHIADKYYESEARRVTLIDNVDAGDSYVREKR